MDPHAAVTIPFDDRVIFIRSLNCAGLSRGYSEITQTLDAIAGVQFLASGRRVSKWGSPGTV